VQWTTPRGKTYQVNFGRDLNADQRHLLQSIVDQAAQVRLRQ